MCLARPWLNRWSFLCQTSRKRMSEKFTRLWRCWGTLAASMMAFWSFQPFACSFIPGECIGRVSLPRSQSSEEKVRNGEARWNTSNGPESSKHLRWHSMTLSSLPKSLSAYGSRKTPGFRASASTGTCVKTTEGCAIKCKQSANSRTSSTSARLWRPESTFRSCWDRSLTKNRCSYSRVSIQELSPHKTHPMTKLANLKRR